jgi:two-component system, OmpR family, response regulator AdeR
MQSQPIILVSDDEPLICTALVRALRRHGIRAEIDSNSQVYELAKRSVPDLIILDFVQPVDALTQLERLRKDPATKNIPVVVVSAVDSDVRKSECLRLGAVDFAIKPFDDGFVERVARLVLGVGLVAPGSSMVH